MGTDEEGFSVTVASGPDPTTGTTVAVVGDLDAGTAGIMADALENVLDTGGGDLVIDGSRLWFIDSAGIKVIVDARNRLLERGAVLELRDLPPSPRKIVELLSLDRIIRVT